MTLQIDRKKENRGRGVQAGEWRYDAFQMMEGVTFEAGVVYECVHCPGRGLMLINIEILHIIIKDDDGNILAPGEEDQMAMEQAVLDTFNRQHAEVLDWENDQQFTRLNG